jgi:hypothetical protein
MIRSLYHSSNSYADDEDDMVKDPWLAEHLQRFGIDIM